MKHLNILVLSMILSSGLVWAQADDALWSKSEDDFYSMTLEELMNVRIVSVSKKSERLFDAPLSSYIISKQDIINAGANSIPEALKLCPGIIVREMANGAYDFHIRGFDNPTQYSFPTSAYNLLTLVMIDNRPVFNHNNGGTFFETLPIDLNDVERIEVVRGPASALYGPNAVTGVINIITSRPEKDGVNVVANAQHGSFNSTIANASLGYKKNKFDLSVSGNIQKRERTTTAYYEYFGDRMVENIADLHNMPPYGSSFYLPDGEGGFIFIPLETFGVPLANSELAYPNPKNSIDKNGINLFANYDLSSNISFNLSAGLSNSESQRVYLTNYTTPLGTSWNDSRYINLAAKVFGGQFRVAYVKGKEDMSNGGPFVYDYNLFDMNIDYDIALGKKLSLRPSFSMQEAVYDDTKNTVERQTWGMINGEATFKNIAGAVRLDFNPTNKLRLIAGFRTDHYNYPDDLYYSYQFSASYLFNPNFMLRSTYSRANSGSYIGNTYFDLKVPMDLRQQLPVVFLGVYNGNRNMKIFVSEMFEVGWRAKISHFLQLDMDLFSQGGTNMMGSIIQPQEMNYDPQGGYFNIIKTRQIQNLDTRIRMYGTTVSASFAFYKLMIKPFITYQYSHLYDFVRYQVSPLADPVNNVNQKIDKKHDTTPDYYGGMSFNYNPIKKLNINLSPYFYGSQQHYLEQDNIRASNIGEIPAKFQLNARIGYKVVRGMDLFISGKNIFNQNVREFYGTDTMGNLYFAGMNFRF